MNKLIIVALAASLCLFTAEIAGAQTARARIADTPVRGGANLASPIIATLTEGAPVGVVDLQGYWYRVLVPNEQGKPVTGYVLAQLIEIINMDGSPQPVSRAERVASGQQILPMAAELERSRGIRIQTEREQALKAYVEALQAEVKLLRNDRLTSGQPSREGLQPPAPSPQRLAGLAPDAQTRSTSTLVTRVKSASTKFFVGAELEGTGLVTAEPGSASTTESGPGVGLVLGYGFTPMWAVYGNLSGASMSALDGDTSGLGHVDVGVRAHFLTGHVVVPFVQGGLSSKGEAHTFINRTGSHDETRAGMGVAFGGGLNVHVRRSLAISTGVTWSVGSFTNYTQDQQTVLGTSVSATSARVHVGIVWFPQTHAVKG